MDDVRLQLLLQEAEEHLRSRSCRQRCEQGCCSFARRRRGIWFGDDKRAAWCNSMLNFYPQFWTRSFDFEGRTSRIDFWKIVLVNLILGVLLSKLAPSALYMVFAVASICPGLAMNIRRIRDTGRPWPWIFIALIPLIGFFWLLWIELQPSADS